MSKQTLRPLTTALRKVGFEFKFRDRSGGATVTEFVKREGNRLLTVQFWQDGEHRACHGEITKLAGGVEGYRATTAPTYFRDLGGMYDAINTETTRPMHA